MCVHVCLCVCFLELVAKVSRARKGSTLFKRDKERERGGGEIGKHGSNSEKRSRNRDEEVVEEEGSGIEGTCERYR